MPMSKLQFHQNIYCASDTYPESKTPRISKIISSNMVHDNEKVIENMSCTNLWWTS